MMGSKSNSCSSPRPVSFMIVLTNPGEILSAISPAVAGIKILSAKSS